MPESLLQDNVEWARKVAEEHPTFFTETSKGQKPRFFWIGCADSRIPANVVVDRLPGEIFVHRNVANQVIPNDLSLLASIHFAVAVLKVEHIIVCGHYSCGGVVAAMNGSRYGLVDNWLQPLSDLAAKHRELLDSIENEVERSHLLAEINVIAQVRSLARTTIVRDAWIAKQPLAIHGFAYVLTTGLLKDLGASVLSEDEVDSVHAAAMSKCIDKRGA